MKLRYFGHSAFALEDERGKVILIDPYLDQNPLSLVKSLDVRADYIVLTHAHGDHLGDAFAIAKRTEPLFICVAELAKYVSAKGFRAHSMQIGGAHDFDFGKLKLTIAQHGSMTPEGQYAGLAAGVLLFIDGKCIYHTGDTGLFLDMKLIGEMNDIDCMLLPIGDNYTMGIRDAVKALEFVRPKLAIPMHYNTFDVIKTDPREFQIQAQSLGIKCLIMNPGEEIEL